MTRIFFLPILSLPLLLAACGAESSKEAGSPIAGEYRQILKITEFDMPGFKGEEKQHNIDEMEKLAGGDEGQKICLKGGEQWKEAGTQMATMLGGNCLTNAESDTDATFELRMQCKATANGDVNILMTGQSHTAGYAVKMTFDMQDPNSSATAKLAMAIDAERVGDCGG